MDEENQEVQRRKQKKNTGHNLEEQNTGFRYNPKGDWFSSLNKGNFASCAPVNKIWFSQN